MNELVVMEEMSDLAVVEWVDQARSALQVARDNFERVRIRDQAKAVQEAAAVLGRRDVQVQASVLVQEAERAIAKANPPRQGERTDLNFGLREPEVSKDLIRNVRKAHDPIEDTEFEQIVEQAVDEGVPLTRKALADVGKRRRREEAREERDMRLSAQETLFPEGQLYTVLLADPPWRYDFSQTENREIENQYPTMSLEDICDMSVREIAYSDSVLYLWTPCPKIKEALEVMEAWGFEYKTNAVWVKEGGIGMGYWWRNQHELLLVGTRGNFSPPVDEKRTPSVIYASRGRHSEKPVIVYELLEDLYPDMAKIELFARKQREGWAVMGNEIDQLSSVSVSCVSSSQ